VDAGAVVVHCIGACAGWWWHVEECASSTGFASQSTPRAAMYACGRLAIVINRLITWYMRSCPA
jgi:hypothetical protein